MSVFDINPGSTSSAIQVTGSTGSVVHQDLQQEGSATGLHPNNAPVEQGSGNQKKIVLDGPLSEIYTKALNMVYNTQIEQVSDTVSQETQQMDAVMVADIHAMTQDKKEAEIQEAQNAAYVYVTDDKSLDSGGLVSAFDNIRVALDSKRFTRTVVCVESSGRINTSRIELLTNMARNFGADVYYTRNAAMKYLSGMHHE